MDFSTMDDDELIELGYQTGEALNAAKTQLDMINDEISRRELTSDLTVTSADVIGGV